LISEGAAAQRQCTAMRVIGGMAHRLALPQPRRLDQSRTGTGLAPGRRKTGIVCIRSSAGVSSPLEKRPAIGCRCRAAGRPDHADRHGDQNGCQRHHRTVPLTKHCEEAEADGDEHGQPAPAGVEIPSALRRRSLQSMRVAAISALRRNLGREEKPVDNSGQRQPIGNVDDVSQKIASGP
jgi:hypothetical protein